MNDIADVIRLADWRGPRDPEPRLAPSVPARYLVCVDLLVDAEPTIWRRAELAGDLVLADLHEVLQTVMGWTDSHLHQFLIGPERDHGVRPFLTDFAEEQGDDGIHERGVRLDQVLAEVGDVLLYDYDFGDGWEHEIRVEEVRPYDAAAPTARVLDGARACPPEDCGGIPGYEEVLDALASRASPDERQRELLDWLGDDYDPEAFSAEETDQLLRITVAGLGGSAAVEAALTLSGSGFSADLRILVDRSRRAPKPLASLIAAAGLAPIEDSDTDAMTATMRPWMHFLDVVGSGITLTKAGWLPPAVVSRIATELDLLESWRGKGNREDLFPPVRNIRECAVALGLVRKRKGELLPTATGLRLGGDPERLWHHVASRLPLGRTVVERAAGAIMLLGVAAGEKPSEGLRRQGGELLWCAGWTEDDRRVPSEWSTFDLARPTWHALSVVGGSTRSRDEQTTPDLRLLARAALRARPTATP
ncbi:MAG: plasmid pRiA4b ORF-3 family protein [Nocardioides sp.]|nr:plasmid pRiA4b ORF-3 family protein [Nocardioides sp.]